MGAFWNIWKNITMIITIYIYRYRRLIHDTWSYRMKHRLCPHWSYGYFSTATIQKHLYLQRYIHCRGRRAVCLQLAHMFNLGCPIKTSIQHSACLLQQEIKKQWPCLQLTMRSALVMLSIKPGLATNKSVLQCLLLLRIQS
jgi:hypothetical protein